MRGLAALTAVWGLSAGLSLQLIPGSPIASASETSLAVAQVRATQTALADPRVFGQAIHSTDPEAAIPASNLLTGLRGKDVLIVFVESYGQVAVQGTSFSPGVDAVLRQQQSMLTQRRLVHRERLGRLPDLRRGQLARPLHRAVRTVG